MKQFKVLFLSINNSGTFQATVFSGSEEAAKIAGRSELMASGLSPLAYHRPIVTVVKPFPPMAALAHVDKRCQL